VTSAGDRTRYLGWFAALVVGGLGFFHLTPQSRDALQLPWNGRPAAEFASATILVAGAAVLLAMLSRRLPWLWPARFARPTPAAGPSAGVIVVVAASAAILYAVIARAVFDGVPLHIDELTLALQSQIYATGHLWLPEPAHREFFTSLNVVFDQGRLYGHFPPGWPAVLALGSLAGTPWLMAPLAGAAAVAVFALLLRDLEPSGATRLGALLLFAGTPFLAFMSASYMSHTATLACLLLGSWGVVHGMAAPDGRRWYAALAGLAFGAACTMRPLDAAAFLLPALAWYAIVAFQQRERAGELASLLAGLALPVAALLWVNWRTTGHPLQFGYQVLWGKDVGLGFHTAPFGEAHTPVKGLGLLNLYFLRLQTFLFETPIPSLLPATLGLALSVRLSPGDRFLLSASALLMLGYFAYWHDGIYLGPRFMLPLVPVFVLWTARLPGLVRQRFGDGLALRTVCYAMLLSAGTALAVLIPRRVQEYAGLLAINRWDAGDAARQAGVQGALVFVRDSWGPELIARMVGLGLTAPEATHVYRTVDACALDEALSAVESDASAGGATVRERLMDRIRPAWSDSLRLKPMTPLPTSTLYVLPGSRYSARCIARVGMMQEGFVPFPPLLLQHAGDNLYVRDLQGRDSVLVRQFPARPLYLLARRHGMESPPEFQRLNRDSMLGAVADTTPRLAP
jgi:hypothetical protein